MLKKKAMLIDTTLCIGCYSCQDACKKEFNLSGGQEKKLSATAYTTLDEYDGTYVRRMCQHCNDPTCASVCPVGAFTKTPEDRCSMMRQNASVAAIVSRRARSRCRGTSGRAIIPASRNAVSVTTVLNRDCKPRALKPVRQARRNSATATT